MGYKVLFGTTACLAVYCLLLTYSRGGWVAFKGAVVILALFKNKLLVQLLAALGLLLYSALPAQITNRLATITSSTDTSNLYRLDTWSSTMEVIKAHWETGVGLGRKAFSRVFYTHMINSNTVPHSHNLYLQVISEFGILGLAVFCWLFIAILRTGIKISAMSINWAKSINAGVMGALAGFFIHSLVDHFLWYYKLGIMLWLLVAIVIVLDKIAVRNSDVERTEEYA
jgi:O-antigen ligase